MQKCFAEFRERLNSTASAPDSSLCPPRVRASIDAYCELGMPPGDFVRSVLANDLYDALTRADDINLPALHHIVAYVVKRVPVSMCGSREKVNKHIAEKAQARKAFGKIDASKPFDHKADGLAYLAPSFGEQQRSSDSDDEADR